MKTARVLVAVLTLTATVPAAACPFCVAESRTLTEEMADASVVVIARLLVPSAASEKLAQAGIPPAFVDPETGAAKFAVEHILKGEPILGDARTVEAIHFGDADTERRHLLQGVEDPPNWAIPLPLSETAERYVRELVTLPAEGSERLAFFLPYLLHEDVLLDQDSYDEFARAPYQDVIDLGPRMDREKLRRWIADPDVSPSRRRLFLTMLGVCGEASDVVALRDLIATDARVLVPGVDAGVAAAMAAGGSPALGVLAEATRYSQRQRKIGLDALIACYLTLAARYDDASEALDLVDDRYLRGGANYSNIFSVLRALRFLGDEQEDLVPRERVLTSARLLLDEPEFADQVITDLARWEDWTVLERLADIYRATFDEDDPDAPSEYLREPVITYLDVAVQVEGDIGRRAQAALDELEPLDPKAVERARSLWGFGALGRAREKGPDPPWVTAELGGTPELASAIADAPLPSDAEAPPNPQAPVPPNPQPTSALSGSPVKKPVEKPAEEAAKEEGAAGTLAESADPTPEITTALQPNPGGTPEAQPEPVPPSRLVLIAAPLVATAALVGLFWLILRSGVS